MQVNPSQKCIYCACVPLSWLDLSDRLHFAVVFAKKRDYIKNSVGNRPISLFALCVHSSHCSLFISIFTFGFDHSVMMMMVCRIVRVSSRIVCTHKIFFSLLLHLTLYSCCMTCICKHTDTVQSICRLQKVSVS